MKHHTDNQGMKLSVECILDTLQVPKIGRLHRLDDAIIGITLGEEHDGEPFRFIYDRNKICAEILAESNPNLSEEAYYLFTDRLIERTQQAFEGQSVFVEQL